MKIVTYNIKNTSKDHPWKGRRDEVLKNIQDQEIICLQELTPWWIAWLKCKLFKTHKFVGGLFGTGMFIHKSYSICETQRLPLFKSWMSVLKDTDRLRFLNYARIRKCDGNTCDYFHIMNMHPGFDEEHDENVNMFMDFFTWKIGFLPRKVLVTGDFNMKYESTMYNDFVNETTLHNYSDGSFTTYHGWRNDPSREATIDFIFTNMRNKDVKTYNKRSLASDHFPVYLEFTEKSLKWK